MANPDLTVHDVAREERLAGAYIYCLLRLPSLAPDIVTAIINGRKPPQLTAKNSHGLSPFLERNTEPNPLKCFQWQSRVLVLFAARRTDPILFDSSS